jgi:hypothetical protein
MEKFMAAKELTQKAKWKLISPLVAVYFEALWLFSIR